LRNPLHPSTSFGESVYDYNARVLAAKTQLAKAYKKFHHKKYDYNPCHCMRAVCSGCCLKTYSCICGCCTNRESKDVQTGESKKAPHSAGQLSSAERLFCSELAASIYIEMGVLPSSLDPETVTPSELLVPGNTGQTTVVADESRLHRLI